MLRSSSSSLSASTGRMCNGQDVEPGTVKSVSDFDEDDYLRVRQELHSLRSVVNHFIYFILREMVCDSLK